MSLDDFNELCYSQDDRAVIGYGGQSDFVSKLIAKAKANTNSVIRTPPPPVRTTRSSLRKTRRDSKEVEMALKALKLPLRKITSPGPTTRSKSTETASDSPRSNPSLDDSTETLFGAIPPTPPLKTQKAYTPQSHRSIPFFKSGVENSSTPISTPTHSNPRSRNRLLAKSAASNSFIGLDKSTGDATQDKKLSDQRQKTAMPDEEDSFDDVLLEATQQAEQKFAQSQRFISKSPVAHSKVSTVVKSNNMTPKIAGGGRVRTTLSLSQPVDDGPSPPKLRSSQTVAKSKNENLSQSSKTPGKPKCSAEEIQKKRQAALLKRKQKMATK